MQLVREGGPEAVHARQLAAMVGTSTMAVYTYFGGMPELLDAVAREGFRLLGASVSDAPTTDDPMKDLFVQGFVYRDWALRNPRVYRLMSGNDMTKAGLSLRSAGGRGPLELLMESMARVRAAREIENLDPYAAAWQFLSAAHGYVLLEITGQFEAESWGFTRVFRALTKSVMVGLGASPEVVEQAISGALRTARAVPDRAVINENVLQF